MKDFDINYHKTINLGDGENDQDVLNKRQIEDLVDDVDMVRLNKNNNMTDFGVFADKTIFHDNEYVAKEFVTDHVSKHNNLRLIQCLEKYLQKSFNGTEHRLQKYIKKSLTYYTNIITSISGHDLFGGPWVLRVKKFSADNYFKCVTSNQNWTPKTGLNVLLSSESNFMYIETSGSNLDNDESSFCSWTTYQFHNITNMKFQ